MLLLGPDAMMFSEVGAADVYAPRPHLCDIDPPAIGHPTRRPGGVSDTIIAATEHRWMDRTEHYPV